LAKKFATWLVGLIGVLLLYLFLWPVPIDPGEWEPPPVPSLEGDFAQNLKLQQMELFATPGTRGPEDVAVGADGRVYVGVEEGKILRYDPDGSNPTVFAETGGRPLGLDFDVDGNLIVADAAKGLLSIDSTGDIEVLCTAADGEPLGFADDVDVDSENVAWFSDASTKWDHHHVMNAALESRPNGRLVKHEIGTGACITVLGELYFANGVAVSPDETYVLVNETMRYRTKRVFVRGPKAGVVETFVDNLPGFPDETSCLTARAPHRGFDA
jgi:sugar lactone lactonase YvrE